MTLEYCKARMEAAVESGDKEAEAFWTARYEKKKLNRKYAGMNHGKKSKG